MAKSVKNKIVVPIDFSEQSLIALSQSYNLAKEYDAELLLLHVVEDSTWANLLSNKQISGIKKEMQKKLDKLAEDASKKHKTPADTMIAKGKAYEKIIEVADMVNATMIIMGCHSRKKLQKFFIGSNALRVVREANCPVITIKGKSHNKGCNNIVLPLDLSKETRDKVQKAIDLAKLGAYKATIHIVSVMQSTDEFLVARLTGQMEQVKTYIQEQEVSCTAEFITKKKEDESLAQAVLTYAKKVKGDLIIIMTQQEANFTRMFIGSTAQEIVNNSDIPVLSIIPKKRKYQAVEEMAV